MNLLQAVILSVIQGFTEFLPVSSSGHLTLGAKFLGLPSPGLSFSIWVHVGTAFATIAMLHREIAWLFKGLFAPETQGDRQRVLTIIGYIIAASVPAAIVGLLFDDLIESSFSSSIVASIGLIVTGCFLQLSKPGKKAGADRVRPEYEQQVLATATLPKSLTVGVCQAIAIVPGISRSGITITSAVLSGMSREDAARFSFLLSLPAVLGAGLLDIRSAMVAQVPLISTYSVVGALISFVTGLFALNFVFKTVRKGELWRFSYYCWAVGAFSLILSFLGS